MGIRIGEAAFEVLADHVAFCLENLRHPSCALGEAGRFYEEVTEALRAHAILRLLIDADPAGFSNDLVMSGHARRAYLRRCARQGHMDYFLALSRSGSMLDAVAGNDLALASEVFALSPAGWRQGDEYEDDFWYQRFLGLFVSGASPVDRETALARFEAVADGGARSAICRALRDRHGDRFEEAFADLLRERREEIEEDKGVAEEEVAAALGTRVFVEGIAVLKLARRAGIPIAREYPMCPMLALLPRDPATPPDEFASP